MPEARRLVRVAAAVALTVALTVVTTRSGVAQRVDDKPTPRSHVEAKLHLQRGQQALAREAWEEAEREFHAAIRLNPLLEMAHYGLGQSFTQRRRYHEAIRAYRGARDAFHEAAGRRISAAAEAQQLLDIPPPSPIPTEVAMPRPHVNRRIPEGVKTPAMFSLALGSAYFRTGDLAAAEAEYRNAIDADASFGEAHNNLAVVCLLTGRLDEAEREIALAGKTGFKVNPQLKLDLQKSRR